MRNGFRQRSVHFDEPRQVLQDTLTTYCQNPEASTVRQESINAPQSKLKISSSQHMEKVTFDAYLHMDSEVLLMNARQNVLPF